MCISSSILNVVYQYLTLWLIFAQFIIKLERSLLKPLRMSNWILKCSCIHTFFFLCSLFCSLETVKFCPITFFTKWWSLSPAQPPFRFRQSCGESDQGADCYLLLIASWGHRSTLPAECNVVFKVNSGWFSSGFPLLLAPLLVLRSLRSSCLYCCVFLGIVWSGSFSTSISLPAWLFCFLSLRHYSEFLVCWLCYIFFYLCYIFSIFSRTLG